MQPIKCLIYVLCLGAVLVSASPAQTNSTRAPIQPRRTELQRALASFASWAKRYATKSGAVTGARGLEEGLMLAKQRRAAFLELIQSDPATALTESLPDNLRNLLPSGIREQLEVPLHGTGDLLVLCAMPPHGARASEALQRFVRLNGRTYTAFVYGRRLGETTKYRIPLHGVALDGVIALDDKVLAELEPEGAPNMTETILDLSAAAGPLGGNGPPVLARMGERIYRFASREHLKHSEALLETAESGLRPSPLEPASVLLERAHFPESEPRTTARPQVAPSPGGLEAKVLIIRADFSDIPGDPRPLSGGESYSASSVQTLADTQVASYYRNSSYGNATLKFTVTPQLYRLPGTAVNYATTGYEFQLYDDAVAAAEAHYVVTNYDKVVVLFSWLGFIPGSQLQFGGLSLIGTSMIWVNGEFDFRVVAHELGHTYGLYHANFWHTGDDNPVSDNGSSIEYGDPFDTMAANWGNDARVDFNPWFKYQINWIRDDQVQTVTESGTYRVYRFDDASATGTLALKIAKDVNRDYWIGYRRNFTENPGLQHGAYVLWGYRYPRQSNLLGLGPTVNSARDAGLVLGTALADAEANVTIVPVAEGGAAPNEYLDVEIVIGPPPMITHQPDSQVALEGFAAQFSVAATGTPMFFWQRQASGTDEWVTLNDGAGYGGTSTPSLQINPTTSVMDGDGFRCLLTNSTGGFNCSRVAHLTVNRFGVVTFAGQPGMPGEAGGFGEIAQFNSPMGIAVDQAGNVYVADTGNHLIRKITPMGAVSTLAGQAGNPGSTDGLGADARFYSPMGLAVDGAGSVYVADQMNSIIRKITPDGSVTTLAGLAGIVGGADGAASEARFNHPGGLAVDCFGNVYVADTGNDSIRVVSPAGVVSTLAGVNGVAGATDGVGAAARFDTPLGIAMDTAGTIFVADQGNSTIRKITFDGAVTTFAGHAGVTGGSDGLGANARFNFPAGLAVNKAEKVYVADRNDSTIREISPVGLVSTLAGASGTNGIADGVGSSALLSFPMAVAVDAQGLIYVADTSANTIRLIRSAPPQPPSLRMNVVAGQIILTWPASATTFALETRTDLSAGSSWAPVLSEPAVVGCSLVVTNDLRTPAAFFRLHSR